MVEVVTSKEFAEFKKSIEKRLDANEKKIEVLVNRFVGRKLFQQVD